MSQQEEALKYLLGLETFPSFYEISKASDEELEERINNWQEQIFTLAGELYDLKKKLKSVEQRNLELQNANEDLKKQSQRLDYKKYISAVNALKEYELKPSKEAPSMVTLNKQSRDLGDPIKKYQTSLSLLQEAKSQDVLPINGVKQCRDMSKSVEADLLYTKEPSQPANINTAPETSKSYQLVNNDKLFPSHNNSVHLQQLNDTKEKLREALEKISSLESELHTQQEYHTELLKKELTEQEKFYLDLLAKKSYLPTSFESLDDCAADDLTFIVDGAHKLVKSGSIRKLVDYLADPSLSDVRFVQIFIFSFHMYMDSKTLLKMILAKLNSIKDTNDVLKISRLINILKHWIDNYFEDFERESSLIGKITTQFQILRKSNSLSGMAEMILKQLDRKMTGSKHASNPVKITAPTKSITSQIVKKVASIKNKNNTGILCYSAEEVAKQLTLLDFKYFFGINIREFLDLNWMKKEKKALSPGITQFITWSNHIAFWVSSEILTKKSVKERVHIMEFMINLAHNMEKLNNFHGMSNVLSGLNTSPIYRLRKTKESLSSKFIKMQESLQEITSTDLNYKKFRQKISVSQPPLIPFIGIYQGDLVFLDSTGNTMLDNDIINYQKVYRMASHVIDLKVL